MQSIWIPRELMHNTGDDPRRRNTRKCIRTLPTYRSLLLCNSNLFRQRSLKNLFGGHSGLFRNCSKSSYYRIGQICLDQCPVTVTVPGYGDTYSHWQIIPRHRSCNSESPLLHCTDDNRQRLTTRQNWSADRKC